MTTPLQLRIQVDSLLQAWLDWGNTYGVFVGENKDFVELMIRTQNLLENPKPEV